MIARYRETIASSRSIGDTNVLQKNNDIIMLHLVKLKGNLKKIIIIKVQIISLAGTVILFLVILDFL